jgi:hypothetical protein
MMRKNEMNIACCWVSTTVEISSPIASAETR